MIAAKGGFAGPDGWVFELTGGRSCLDFVNTVDNRPSDRPKELLATYLDLVSWSKQAGVLGDQDAERLLREANHRTVEAKEVLDRSHRLREALFALFSSVAEGVSAPAEAVSVLNDELPASFSSVRIESADPGYRLRWVAESSDLDRMLAPVVGSAIDLLTSEELNRVRVCAASNCAWLFLDQSRNRTRQWCDMSVCGNRAKARRHYRRSKKLKVTQR